ncbi:hypothetical protein ACTL6U_21190 [Rhodovibrionaceae bacterium A322]
MSSVLAHRLEALLARQGQKVTLLLGSLPDAGQPWLSAGSPQEVTMKALVRGYQPSEIQGAIEEGDREVRLAAKALPEAPKAGRDSLRIGARTLRILSVETRHLGEEALLHLLQVRG